MTLDGSVYRSELRLLALAIGVAASLISNPALAQQCEPTERNATKCVKQDLEYRIKQVFAFNEIHGRVYQFNNLCPGKVRVVASLDANRVVSLKLEAKSKIVEKTTGDDEDETENRPYSMPPNLGSLVCTEANCGKLVHWVACSQRELTLQPSAQANFASRIEAAPARVVTDEKKEPIAEKQKGPAPAPPHDGKKTEPTKPKVTFTGRDNWDLTGQDLRTLPGLSMDECKDACRSDRACVGLTFDRWNRFCFLKSGIASLRLEPKATSAWRDGTPTPSISSAERIMEPYKKRKFAGILIDSKLADNVALCRSSCADLNQCLGFSFFSSSRQCLRFSQLESYSIEESVESGGKRQILDAGR